MGLRSWLLRQLFDDPPYEELWVELSHDVACSKGPLHAAAALLHDDDPLLEELMHALDSLNRGLAATDSGRTYAHRYEMLTIARDTADSYLYHIEHEAGEQVQAYVRQARNYLWDR